IRAPATPRSTGSGSDGDGTAPVTRTEPTDGTVHTAAVQTVSVSAQPLAAKPAAQSGTQEARESNDDRRRAVNATRI
ncbi:hypothetical protein BZM27_25105, partial [Paraburkholderia steynii]